MELSLDWKARYVFNTKGEELQILCLASSFVLLGNLGIDCGRDVRLRSIECCMISVICGSKLTDRDSSLDIYQRVGVDMTIEDLVVVTSQDGHPDSPNITV